MGRQPMIVDESDLVRWGRRIGESLQGPAFIGLKGPLGAGKSVLARAVAEGAGVEDTMPSPTFNLLFRYETPDGIRIVHLDLYRLEDPGELWELGWEELGADDEVVLVEWPERAGDLLPEDRWEIELSVPGPEVQLEGRREEYRRVGVSRYGNPPHLPGFPVRVER